MTPRLTRHPFSLNPCDLHGLPLTSQPLEVQMGIREGADCTSTFWDAGYHHHPRPCCPPPTPHSCSGPVPAQHPSPIRLSPDALWGPFPHSPAAVAAAAASVLLLKLDVGAYPGGPPHPTKSCQFQQLNVFLRCVGFSTPLLCPDSGPVIHRPRSGREPVGSNASGSRRLGAAAWQWWPPFLQRGTSRF